MTEKPAETLKSLCRAGDPKLRSRARLLLRALELGSPAQACREAGISPQLYQYWWRRFRDSGFRREGLLTRSRRPKRSPKKIPPEVERWIEAYRRELRCSGEKIRLLLEQERQVRVSLPTVYRVLARNAPQGPRRTRRAGHAGAASPDRDAGGKGPAPRRARSAEVVAASPLPSEASPPRRIADRYRVLRRLGGGGGGVVYLVEDEAEGGARRALKWVEAARGSDPGLGALLENEFAALAGLEHPNLARVHDLGVAPGGIYFTSDYIVGRDLLAATREADLNHVFQLILQVLGALDYLHGKGILHLDLKPENILVAEAEGVEPPRVKLIDFGGAEWRRRGRAAAGETMGTPPYVAPELLLEQAPGPAADLYAFGMLLHQIFFGAFPLRHRDPLLMMQEQIYEEPLALVPLPPALPESFGVLLRRMVARNPRARFASAREVLAAMNESLGEDFRLSAPALPQGILAESRYDFSADLIHELAERLASGAPGVTVLSGAPGSGKSRLLARVKEVLQLRRVFPVRVAASAQLEAALSRAARAKAPLLVDLPPESEDLPALLERLDEAGLPALLATRRGFSLELLAPHWLELKPWTREQVLEFLWAELRDLPDGPLAAALAELGVGSPERLETLLQALQESGALQWTDGAWAWRPEGAPDPARLLPEHAARWRERRARVVEILRALPPGLDAETLAGLLDVEAAWLVPHLEAWVREGLLKRREARQIRRYALAASDAIDENTPATRGWGRIEAELERLYAEGRFEAGARWADRLRAEAAELPPAAALRCARLYVASGEAERALKTLPAQASPEERGLACEIRARAAWALGNLESAEAALREAEGAYLAREDLPGRSRAANLRGSIAKQRLDFSAAAESFAAAIELAERAADPYLQGLAEMNLALLRQERGDFRAAARLFAAAELSAGRAAHPWLQGRLLQNWINLLFYLGRAAEAEQRCYALLRLAIVHRYPELQAVAHNSLALLAGQRGRRELQETQLNLALHLLRPRGLWLPYAQTLLNRAFFLWEQGRYTAAELDAGYALDLAQRLRHPHFKALAQLVLGRILRDRPNPDLAQAAASLNRAHQGLHRLNHRPLLWEVAFDRGLVAKRLGEPERARACIEAALRDLEGLLAELPDFARESYLRDRKLEKIRVELS
ncbi:hypothetical protein FBR05_13480 [Deltaproteobacteria bacterium PRO3]|nr:hypothetical protein [Deltaproteobacteria bacterium PRO3]